MKQRTAGRVSKPRLCAFCKGPLVESKAIFLVANSKGVLVGPYHAGCCDKLVAMGKGQKATQEPLGDEFGHLLLPTREETLPW